MLNMSFQNKIRMLAVLKVGIVVITTVIAFNHFKETNEAIFRVAMIGNALLVIDEFLYCLFVIRRTKRESKILERLRSIFKVTRCSLYSVIFLKGTSLQQARFSDDLIICYIILVFLDIARAFYFEYGDRNDKAGGKI